MHRGHIVLRTGAPAGSQQGAVRTATSASGRFMADHDGVVAVVNVSRSWPDVRAGIRSARDVVLGDWNPFKGNRPPQLAFDPGAVRTVFGYSDGFLTEVFDIDPDEPFTWLNEYSPARIRWNALPSSRWEKLRGAPSPISWRQGQGTPVKLLTMADLEAGSRVFSWESLNEDWPKFRHWHFETWDGGSEVPVTTLEKLLPQIWLSGENDAEMLRAFRWLANWHPAPQELKAEAEEFLASGHPDLGSFLAARQASRQGTQGPASALNRLARRAFEIWEQARSQVPATACAAMPVLFFGDVDACMRSPLRIITVGLSPSQSEFPDNPEKFPGQDRFWRFREAQGITSLASPAGCKRYIKALSGYFSNAPYGWFDTYKGLLDGMDASFHTGAASTALHTDLCSPVATNPTWSGLSNESKAMLLAPGRDLWHDLVRVLRPQVMLVSVAREHLDHIHFKTDGDWAELYQVEQKKPYIVKYKRMSLDDGAPTLAVFGTAAQTPFGTVSQQDKFRIGGLVKGLIDG